VKQQPEPTLGLRHTHDGLKNKPVRSRVH
jgi:hypothetical protein